MGLIKLASKKRDEEFYRFTEKHPKAAVRHAAMVGGSLALSVSELAKLYKDKNYTGNPIKGGIAAGLLVGAMGHRTYLAHKDRKANAN